jgi:hypothetical protein
MEGLSFTEERLHGIMDIALHPAMGEVVFGMNITLSVNVTSKEQANQVISIFTKSKNK